jgi:hypothetical protein
MSRAMRSIDDCSFEMEEEDARRCAGRCCCWSGSAIEGEVPSGADCGVMGGEEASLTGFILVATTLFVVDNRRLRRPTKLGDRERTAVCEKKQVIATHPSSRHLIL